MENENSPTFRASSSLVDNTSQWSNQDSQHQDAHRLALLIRLVFLATNAVVSVVGNSLSLAVFTRSRLRGTPSSGYLASLAVADTGSAVTVAVGVAMAIYGAPSVVLQCNITYFCNYVFQFLAVWFLVCFTVERYVSVCFPLRAKDILRRFSVIRVVLVFVVVACGIYSPYLVSTMRLDFQLHLQLWFCPWVNQDLIAAYVKPLRFVTFATHFVLPMAVIGVLNSLIIRQMCKSSPPGEAGSQVSDDRGARQRYVTVTLLVVCLVFFLCHFPFNLIYLLSEVQVEVNEWLFQALQMLFKLSYSTNFFLYAMTGSLFRTSLKSLFKRGRDVRRSSYALSTWRSSSRRNCEGEVQPQPQVFSLS